MQLSDQIRATTPPPVMEARRWLAEARLPDGLPLINVSQAAPVDPPPAAMRDAMAEMVRADDASHLYGPVLGLPDLRAALADNIASHYAAKVAPEQIAITSGCNQAFAAIIATLCDAGDEVLLPTPWYFNHKMWLDMSGVRAVPLPTGPDLLPDPDAVTITPRTRAIVLVSPNNPGGVEYPADRIAAFHALAEAHGLTLVVDETYRDFDSRSGPPHPLFQDAAWSEHFVHLYSFSKAYRLTGHRVGAIAASPERLAQVEKFLDTVTICPNQLGQRAALWGLEHLAQWVAGERAEILTRRAAIETHMPKLAAQGWRLKGLGAYFAYLEHPFDGPSDALAQRLVSAAGVLLLPGTMFRPETDPEGAREVRIAFANLNAAGIATLFDRLATHAQNRL